MTLSPLVEKTVQTIFNNPREYIQQNEWEIRNFLELVEQHLKPQYTLELGTWRGNNASLLSLVTGTKTITLDIQDYGGSGLDLPSHNLMRLIRNARLPDTVAEIIAIFGRPMDLLFIDDGHRIEEVTEEYNLWYPLVRKGGWIAFHDINPNANQCAPGVHPDICQSHVFWSAITGNKKEIIEGGASPGIGLIIK